VLIPHTLLWSICRYRDKYLLSLLVPLIGLINFQLNSPTSISSDSLIKGCGLFRIESIRSPSKNLYLYKGKFKRFCSNEKCYNNISCTIAFRGKERPNASYDYFIEGSLKNCSNRFISFKPKKNLKWSKEFKRRNFNETRFKLKQSLKHMLSKKLKDSLSRSLITSLITGEVDNKLLRFSFARLGLSHVLAISGFHFALVIAFFSFFLNKVLPKKLFLVALVIVAVLYFLFIGMTPSVFRAFTLVVMYIVAKLFAKNALSMNLMGFSMLLNLIFMPNDAYHLGFQLSYLSYSSIIIFYPLVFDFLKKIIHDHDVKELSLISKNVYLVLKYFRCAISLNLAVSLPLFPVLLFYFSKFPLYSLVYNLFIPLFISFLLYLVILAMFAPFLFYFVNLFSKFLLRVILYPPTICEYVVIYKGLSINLLLIFLTGSFLFAVLYSRRKQLELGF